MHDLHFHDLRHTFGTWLVQAEVDYVVIESRCEGHRATGYTMDSKNESVALRAAEALLDRGYGRPMHGVELELTERDPHSHVGQSHLCDAI